MIEPRGEQHLTELSLLAYCIRDGQPQLASAVFAACGAETSVHNDTRAVAEAIHSLVERQEAIDLAGIAKTMKDKGSLAVAGGAGFLAGIVQGYGGMILTESRLFETAGGIASGHSRRDGDGEDVTPCVVEPLDESQAGRGDDRPPTKSQEYALETLVKALRHEGTTTVRLEAWRKYFYEGHTADNEDAKRQAFLRARSGLVERGKVYVINDSYGVTIRDNTVTCTALSRTRDVLA